MTANKARYHHGDLRNVLLEETTRMIQEAGVQAVTLRALSERIGVSRAAPYRHFADKTALLCAVAAGGFEGLTRELRRVAGQPRDDGLEDIVVQGVAYVQFAIVNPSRYRLMFGPILQAQDCAPQLKKAAVAAYDELFKTLDRYCIGAGWSPAQIEFLARTAWALLHGQATLHIDRLMELDDPIAQTRFSLTALLEGLGDASP